MYTLIHYIKMYIQMITNPIKTRGKPRMTYPNRYIPFRYTMLS